VAADYQRAYGKIAPRVKGFAPADQLPAHRHRGGKLLRRSGLPQRAAVMILVTGGTGFIGSHLLEKLSALGEPARCLLRRKARPRGLPAGIEAAYGDLIGGEGVEEAVRGADTVIHLAGVTKALAARDYYAGNVRATETLLRAVAGRGIRLVHVSTLAAIGPSRDGTPVDEDASHAR